MKRFLLMAILVGVAGLAVSSPMAAQNCTSAPTGYGSLWWQEYAAWCSACGGTPNANTTSCTPGPNWGKQPPGHSLAGDVEKRLMKAASDGDLAEVKSLLQKGADINATGLIASISTKPTNYNEDVPLFLIQQGAKLDVADDPGETALHKAAIEGRIYVIQSLLEKGANIEAKDIIDETPLFKAATQGDREAVRLLIREGATSPSIVRAG